MKDSYHIFSNGCLKRKDNTISFVSDEDGVRRDIPIERVSDIYVMSEISFPLWRQRAFFQLLWPLYWKLLS